MMKSYAPTKPHVKLKVKSVHKSPNPYIKICDVSAVCFMRRRVSTTLCGRSPSPSLRDTPSISGPFTRFCIVKRPLSASPSSGSLMPHLQCVRVRRRLTVPISQHRPLANCSKLRDSVPISVKITRRLCYPRLHHHRQSQFRRHHRHLQRPVRPLLPLLHYPRHLHMNSSTPNHQRRPCYEIRRLCSGCNFQCFT